MLTEMYGNGLLQKYGDKPGPMWRKVISELSDDQIKLGMERLMDEGGAFAPSLPEFRAACIEAARVEVGETEIELLAYQMIPSFERETLSRRDLEFLAKRNMERARAILVGEKEPSEQEKNTLARVGLKTGKDLVRQ